LKEFREEINFRSLGSWFQRLLPLYFIDLNPYRKFYIKTWSGSDAPFARYSLFKLYTVTLKLGFWVTQGHRKRHYSTKHIRLYMLPSVMGKILYNVIFNQNQNHHTNTDLKSRSCLKRYLKLKHNLKGFHNPKSFSLTPPMEILYANIILWLLR